MTPSEFKAILRDTSYKPGYEVELRENSLIRHGFELVVTARVMDAENFGDKAYINLVRHIHEEQMDRFKPNDVLDMLYRMWRQLEMHEVSEFFKYKGRHFVDPHPL